MRSRFDGFARQNWHVAHRPCDTLGLRGAERAACRSSSAMHSFWQRLNALFFYALSVLGFLSFMAAGTTYWHKSDPKIELNLAKISLCARKHSP